MVEFEASTVRMNISSIEGNRGLNVRSMAMPLAAASTSRESSGALSEKRTCDIPSRSVPIGSMIFTMGWMVEITVLASPSNPSS